MGRIAARGLGKRYKFYPQRWRQLAEWLTGDRYQGHTDHWVLRDVSFDIAVGEAVGIIGMNGAGKSTLLRILTGTTPLTEGTCEISGRVAALLELGLGMHPEFSGWQNATLACQLMGLAPEVIERCLPEIHTFSELGDYMDRPVRTYSSGMQVRLAFSVATAVRPDLLIVDEALAIGDAYFQHKSMGRIRAFKEQGTTLVLVTHDPGALKALCDRALLLDRGMLLRDGPAEAVFNYYNAMIAQKEKEAAIAQILDEAGRAVTRSGSREAEIVAIELRDTAGHPCRTFRVGDTATLEYRVRIKQAMPTPTVGFLIRDRLGSDAFGTNTLHLGVPRWDCVAGDELVATFTVALHLGVGHYSLSAAVHLGSVHLDGNFDWWDHALVFQVIPNDAYHFVGVAALPTRATVTRLPQQ